MYLPKDLQNIVQSFVHHRYSDVMTQLETARDWTLQKMTIYFDDVLKRGNEPEWGLASSELAELLLSKKWFVWYNDCKKEEMWAKTFRSNYPHLNLRFRAFT